MQRSILCALLALLVLAALLAAACAATGGSDTAFVEQPALTCGPERYILVREGDVLCAPDGKTPLALERMECPTGAVAYRVVYRQ